MRLLPLIGSFVIGSLMMADATAAGPNDQAKTVVIPLNQIWAWSMPGTRPMSESVKPGQPLPKEAALMREIRRALSSRPPEGKEARACFAVLGDGMDGLREAHAVLVKGEEPRQSLPIGKDVSVAFFSYQGGVYVHLDKVERRAGVINIRYRLVPHFSREATEHFALIPLGKLPAGKVHVEIIQSPLEQKLVDLYRVPPLRPELGRQIVCKSFSFSVENETD